MVAFLPPTTRTLPFGRSVAVLEIRAVDGDPVFDQVLASLGEGIVNSSAEEREVLLPLDPPATRSLPFGRRVAVCR